MPSSTSSTRARPRVVLLYNEPVLPPGHPDAESEREVLGTVEAVAQALSGEDLEIIRLGAGRDPADLLSGLRRLRPDVVFNLFEGLGDQPGTEVTVTALLEWLGASFTGSPSLTLALAHNKHLAKRLFAHAGLPTPPFFLVEDLPVGSHSLSWPVIVKPACQDASVGITQASVVTSQEALEERVAWVLERYGGPVLVEHLILGRELSLSLMETPALRPLPFYEIHFQGDDAGLWPIYDYEAKWNPESPEYEAAPISFGITVESPLKETLEQLAMRAYRALGCRDYARVDFRVDAEGRPYILEVNPNPDIYPDAGLAICLEEKGMSYNEFIVGLVRRALERGRRGGPSGPPAARAASVPSPPVGPSPAAPGGPLGLRSSDRG